MLPLKNVKNTESSIKFFMFFIQKNAIKQRECTERTYFLLENF